MPKWTVNLCIRKNYQLLQVTVYFYFLSTKTAQFEPQFEAHQSDTSMFRNPSPPLRRYDLQHVPPAYLAGVIACLNELSRPRHDQKASDGQQATNTRDVTSQQPPREWPISFQASQAVSGHPDSIRPARTDPIHEMPSICQKIIHTISKLFVPRKARAE